MSTTIEKLKIITRILEENLPWQARDANSAGWYYPGEGSEADAYYRQGYEIRIKPWTIPAPPDGRQWHKPEAITREMWNDGWRPLLIGEVLGEYEYTSGTDSWNAGRGMNKHKIVVEDYGFLRTRRPLPQPEKWVPLGPDEVPPNSIFRFRNWGSDGPCCWVLPLQVTQNAGVLMGETTPTWYYWEELDETFEINRSIPETGKWDPQAWVPCKKREGGV